MTIAVDVQVFAQCHQHLLTLGEMLKQPTTQKLILFIGEKVNVCVCVLYCSVHQLVLHSRSTPTL